MQVWLASGFWAGACSGLAEELLRLSTLDHATRSIRTLCKQELEHIRSTGMFAATGGPSGSLLWTMISMMSKYFYAETQSIEGLNSIVKLLGRRAPGISLELLSSRLTIKRMLGQSNKCTGCQKAWLAIKDFAEAQVLDLTEYSSSSLPVLADSSRWAAAGSQTFQLCLKDRNQPKIKDVLSDQSTDTASNPEHPQLGRQPVKLSELLERGFLPTAASMMPDAARWAKSYNLGWKWCTGGGAKRKVSKTAKVKQAHTLDGFGVIVLPTPDLQETAYYLVVDRFSHSVAFSRLLCFKKQCNDSEPVECIRWQHDGSRFADSIESSLLFLKYYETCLRGSTVPVHSAFLSRELRRELFMSPGHLSVSQLMEHAVFLFDMTNKVMQGVSTSSSKKKRPKSKPQPPHGSDMQEDRNSGRPAESSGQSEGDCNRDDGWNSKDEAFLEADLLDTSGSDDNVDAVDAEHAEIDASASTTKELRDSVRALSAGAGAAALPSARAVSQTAGAIAGDAPVTPAAELEEEALLLLLRQHREETQTRPAKSQQSRARRLRLEGVGDARPPHPVADTDTLAKPDRDGRAAMDDCDETIETWATNCCKTMRALQHVRKKQHGHGLGSNRSISLVMLYAVKVDGCHCVRCKSLNTRAEAAMTDPPELLWVSWLDNHPSHGLLGRRARQVRIDNSRKVVYSTAGSTFMGYPDLQCDSRHADVMVEYVGASMRKVRKTSANRDEVDESFLHMSMFCQTMVDRLHGMYLQDEECADVPCMACKATHGHVAHCPMCCLSWHFDCVESLANSELVDGSDSLSSFLHDARDLVKDFRACLPRVSRGISWWDALVSRAPSSSASSSSSDPGPNPQRLVCNML